MQLDFNLCEQARLARDRRFDGRFFIAVKTTGIFCRPVCPVRQPKSANVTYYVSAAAALEAGYRPCLRCRPESAPGTPAWRGTSATVARGLKLIHDGVLDQDSVSRLAERLGVTSRHLSRLFMRHVGASPKAIAQTRRLLFAKTLISETDLAMTEIALASGYGSLRRFNDHFRQTYQRTPSELRRRQPTKHTEQLSIPLAYRPPYNWDAMLGFLAKRAVPGVEWVEAGTWYRNLEIEGSAGRIAVTHNAAEQKLLCRLNLPSVASLYTLIERVRTLFDLHTEPQEINDKLAADRELKPLLEQHPGLRVPGAWDPFEIAVRAITGQQISVSGATLAMGKIAARFGTRLSEGYSFPSPAVLCRAREEDFPMPRTRAGAIIRLAQAVDTGEIELDGSHDPDRLKQQLTAIKGIGEWTANYIAMRVLSDPDAFLHTDLVLLKVAKQLFGDDSPKALLERSQAWRPWRAYAGMYLWTLAAHQATQSTPAKTKAALRAGQEDTGADNKASLAM